MVFKLKSSLGTAWLVWGLGALFYLFGFFQRMAPAVMTDELMREFGINAAALGNLSGLYFYSYVAMQIPTGIIADTWGPRRLLSVGALVAGVGTVLFALSPQLFWAGVGRFLIGGSVAVAFVGLLKLSSTWFPLHLYSTVGGIALGFGMAGAILAGTPLRLMMNLFSWRSVMLLSAVFVFLLGTGIWIFVRDTPREKGFADQQVQKKPAGTDPPVRYLRGIVEVLTYPSILPLCFIPGGIVGCLLTFTGLWGVPFLTTHYGLPTSRAAAISSAALVAWGVSGPVFGWLSDRMGNRKKIYLVGCAASLTGCAVIFFVEALPMFSLTVILLMTGFSSGCVVLSFAFAKESVPEALSGTVSGLINMGIMMGPTLLQPAVGWMLDRNWQGEIADGVRLYNLGAYHSGFLLMIAWALLSFILLFFTRETHCRQTV